MASTDELAVVESNTAVAAPLAGLEPEEDGAPINDEQLEREWSELTSEHSRRVRSFKARLRKDRDFRLHVKDVATRLFLAVKAAIPTRNFPTEGISDVECNIRWADHLMGLIREIEDKEQEQR